MTNIQYSYCEWHLGLCCAQPVGSYSDPESGNHHLMPRLPSELPTVLLLLPSRYSPFFNRAFRMIFLKSDINSCSFPTQNLPIASMYTQSKIQTPFHGIHIPVRSGLCWPLQSFLWPLWLKMYQYVLAGCNEWRMFWLAVPLSCSPLNILDIFPDYLFRFCPHSSSSTGFAVPGTYQAYFHLH